MPLINRRQTGADVCPLVHLLEFPTSEMVHILNRCGGGGGGGEIAKLLR